MACALTASQRASRTGGARSQRKRTPFRQGSLAKPIMFASRGSKPKQQQRKAA